MPIVHGAAGSILGAMLTPLRPSAPLALVGACLATAVTAAEVAVEKDIPYLGPERAQKMDAYLPSAEKFPGARPAVIWIHGGGWSSGSKSNKRELNVCTTLAEHGYAAFSIDYLLASHPAKPAASAPAATAGGAEGGGEEAAPEAAGDRPVPWPQNLYDCKTALRYIRQEAARFRIDPARIAVSGGSAGGHLALMVGLTGDDAGLNQGGLYTAQSNRVSCIIDFYGAAEVTATSRAWKFGGRTPEETAANLRLASPLTHIATGSPPTLIVHGTKDPTVPLEHSRRIDAALTAAGVPHRFIQVPEAGHAFDLQPKEMDLRPAVLEFLGRYLGEVAKP
jgi:acetyl esterase/lipase